MCVCVELNARSVSPKRGVAVKRAWRTCFILPSLSETASLFRSGDCYHEAGTSDGGGDDVDGGEDDGDGPAAVVVVVVVVAGVFVVGVAAADEGGGGGGGGGGCGGISPIPPPRFPRAARRGVRPLRPRPAASPGGRRRRDGDGRDADDDGPARQVAARHNGRQAEFQKREEE